MAAAAGTPPPMSGTSTPGFGDFMTGLTPGGFFSANYHLDSNLDNPFEKSFGENNPSLDTTAEPFSKSLHAPAESGSLYGFPSSSSFFNSPYPAKMEITPPATATDIPADWQFGDSLGGPQIMVNHIGTDIPPSQAKIQYGQATPPDEQSLREPGLDEVNTALSHQQRPSTSKRESSSSGKSTRSTKRIKKATRSSSVAEDSVENGEEGEKRSKFLERNRVAASKCRQKKKEHNAALEQRAKNLERENALLKMTMESLQTEKINLMTQMASHTPDTCDCHEIHHHLAHFKAKYNTSMGPVDAGHHDAPSPASTMPDRTNSITSSDPTVDQDFQDETFA